LIVATPATSKGEMPAAWVLSRSDDLELAAGPYCFTDSVVNPPWLRGRCEQGAPPRSDLPVAIVACGQRAVFEILHFETVSTIALQVGGRRYELTPRRHWTEPQGTYYTARWRVHGHSGLVTLTVVGEQGRIAYLAKLRIRHPGCR
jgi:hypothetical protein